MAESRSESQPPEPTLNQKLALEVIGRFTAQEFAPPGYRDTPEEYYFLEDAVDDTFKDSASLVDRDPISIFQEVVRTTGLRPTDLLTDADLFAEYFDKGWNELVTAYAKEIIRTEIYAMHPDIAAEDKRRFKTEEFK